MMMSSPKKVIVIIAVKTATISIVPNMDPEVAPLHVSIGDRIVKL
jgi:hypothetical protein